MKYLIWYGLSIQYPVYEMTIYEMSQNQKQYLKTV